MSTKRKISPLPSHIDFIATEKKWLAHWYGKGIIEKYLKKNSKSRRRFSFMDGPITANNPMGVHHAWGRTYKDLWQRYKNMRGFAQRFQNGFDCQGLWVEVEVEKELGLKSKKDIENLVPGDRFLSIAKFVELCKQRVRRFAAVQTEQSERLGYFMDWDNSYYTMSDENNYHIWHYLKRCHEKGWLYKGRDSVPWCPRCGTAISQHEILTEQYRELTHKTVVFRLPLADRTDTSLLAWTTTPWTIPGNVALAVNPERSYWEMEKDGERVILINPTATGDLEKETMLINKLGLTQGWKKTRELSGSDLIGLTYHAPYEDLPAVAEAMGKVRYQVVAADPMILPVNTAEGTGIVHIAPGAGSEDHALGKKEKLPAIEEIDESGVFLEGFSFLSNLSVSKASAAIIADLEKHGLAFKIADYTHRYPTCWRCKTELVWRVVDEWYIAMDVVEKSKASPEARLVNDGKSQMPKADGNTYREQMIKVAKQINWIPQWGLERELDWLRNMHDWLISKKRYWGLALPIFECERCSTFEVIGSKEELRERAVAGWETFKGKSPHRPWIDQVKIECSHCRQVVSRIPDVGNPWLDAGIVPYSTLNYLSDRTYWRQWFPTDFVTEAFPGQFKNWFYALIAMSTVLEREPPFLNLLGHALVRDEKGEEMHKSKGNAIEFNEAADKIGVDVMRWLYATQSPEVNLNFGFEAASEIRRRWYLIFWNTVRFFTEYVSAEETVVADRLPNHKSLKTLDRWILSELTHTARTATKGLDKYNARLAAVTIESFIHDLSTWYIRRSRDRVGFSAESLADRQVCYQVLYYVLCRTLRLLAPFTPFIAEELYTHLTGEESVHLTRWPAMPAGYDDDQLRKTMRYARGLAERGHAIRKASGIKLRQPLSVFYYQEGKPGDLTDPGVLELLQAELNVKKVQRVDDIAGYAGTRGVELDKEGRVALDTTLSPKLLAEGEARELIRQIQKERRRLGTRLDQKVNVMLLSWPEGYSEEIKRKTLAATLSRGGRFEVTAIP